MRLFLMALLLVGISSCCKKNILNVDYGKLNPNDFEISLSIFPEFRDKKIYQAGVYHDIPNEYGENDWVITYKGQQKCQFRHFKKNRRYTHKYKFVFYENQDTLYCDIDIRGKNSQKMTLYFISTLLGD